MFLKAKLRLASRTHIKGRLTKNPSRPLDLSLTVLLPKAFTLSTLPPSQKVRLLHVLRISCELCAFQEHMAYRSSHPNPLSQPDILCLNWDYLFGYVFSHKNYVHLYDSICIYIPIYFDSSRSFYKIYLALLSLPHFVIFIIILKIY